jgi:hypothetical protein
MGQFTATINSIRKYGNYETKAREAVASFVKIYNSDEFKLRVVNFKWKGQNQFADSAGLTNEQVYNKILSGSEIANAGNDFDADINLKAYSKGWPLGSAIGFTDPDDNLIYTKWHFIKKSTVKELAAHYAHEYCHCLGFEHDFEDTDQRPFSVPYAIGDIIEELL